MLTRIALAAVLLLATPALAQAPQPEKTPAAQPKAPKPRAELRSPGAEPRVALRYAPKPDSRWTVRPTTKVTPTSEVDGTPAPVMDPPGMTRPFDLTLEGSPDPAAGQGFSLFVAPQTPEVSPDGSEELRLLINRQPLTPGPAVRVRLSPRGEILEKQAPERSARRPSESEMGILDGLIIPLPEQPVGVGATWRINRVEGVRGYLGRHGLEATLIALKGSRATIRLSYSAIFRTADDDALAKVRKQLPDATIEGSSRAVEVSGEFEIDLTCPVPISGSLLSKERDEIRLRTKGVQSRMIVGSDTKLDLAPAKAQ
jgi:hypothetical protein